MAWEINSSGPIYTQIYEKILTRIVCGEYPSGSRLSSVRDLAVEVDNGMKVSQVIDYFSDFYEDFPKDRAYGMLAAPGINAGVRLKTLPKGTKEKVQLILVMSRRAGLYILDEPIAGAGPAARDYILRTIIANYNPGSTTLLSTHLISDIEGPESAVHGRPCRRAVFCKPAHNDQKAGSRIALSC